MWILNTDSEILDELKTRCREIRLSQNMTQQEVAERAGIPLRAYRRFEQENRISLERFVAVVRALNRAEDLESLLRPPPIRDLKELDSVVPKRKRARKS